MNIRTTKWNVVALILTIIALAFLFCMPNAVNAQAANQPQAPIAGLPKGWLNNMRKRSASYLEFANASFTLDEGQVGLLEIELDNRISDQWHVERDLIDNPPTPPSDDSAEEAKRFAETINAAYNEMPLNPERVAEWIVNTIAAPAEAQEGRSRFLELCVRLDLENKSNVTMAENKVKLSRLFRSGRARILKLSPDGVLVPAQQVKRVEVPQGLLLQLHQNAGDADPNSMMVRTDLPPPVPCLLQSDLWADWPARAGRTPGAKAYELFQDFHFRTWWVLAGETAVYKAAIRAESNAALATVIDRSGLRPQIDALLHELRCRVHLVSVQN